MTGSIRSTARNPVAIALMGLLILVFLVLGVGGGGRFPDAFRATRADSVVTAGGHAVGAQFFQKAFEQEKQKYETDSKQLVSREALVRAGFDQQLLRAMALEQAQAEMLGRAGVSPSPALVDAQIKKQPLFFDRVTGKFSQQQFTQFLANQGLTPRLVQEELTDELAQRHFLASMQAGFKIPRIYAALGAVGAMENRDVSYFTLDPKSVPTPPPPTDAQLSAFMKEHAAQITRPEMRVLTLVRISAAAISPSVTIDDAAVQKEFAFRKDSLSTPEIRTVIQIPVKTAAEAAAAVARLSRGDDPAAIAHALGAEPVSYVEKPQSAIADRKLAIAAFGLKAGQVAGPVPGDLGLAALKVLKITPAVGVTLQSARAKIEADLRNKAARDRAYQMSQKFDDARQAGASVADAAQKIGASVLAIGPVNALGVGLDGTPAAALNEKILKDAFAQHPGEDADLHDAGQGEYFEVKVDRVLPPALPSLDEARPQLGRAFMTQSYLAAIKARAESLMAKVRGGASLDQVAQSIGARVMRESGMQRVNAQKYQALGRDFLVDIFGAKPGTVFAAGGPTGIFIARLDAVRPGEAQSMVSVLDPIRGRLSQDYMRDVVDAAKSAAEQKVPVSVNVTLARQAIGVDPNIVGKPGDKGAANAK